MQPVLPAPFRAVHVSSGPRIATMFPSSVRSSTLAASRRLPSYACSHRFVKGRDTHLTKNNHVGAEKVPQAHFKDNIHWLSFMHESWCSLCSRWPWL
jgi:hypothetical protein